MNRANIYTARYINQRIQAKKKKKTPVKEDRAQKKRNGPWSVLWNCQRVTHIWSSSAGCSTDWGRPQRQRSAHSYCRRETEDWRRRAESCTGLGGRWWKHGPRMIKRLLYFCQRVWLEETAAQLRVHQCVKFKDKIWGCSTWWLQDESGLLTQDASGFRWAKENHLGFFNSWSVT